MDELRWILLIIGAVIVAGIYGYGQWQERRHRPRTGGRGRREPVADPDIADALKDIEDTLHNRDPLSQRQEQEYHADQPPAREDLQPPPVLDDVVVPSRETESSEAEVAPEAPRRKSDRKSILPGRKKQPASAAASTETVDDDSLLADKVVSLSVMSQSGEISGGDLRRVLEGLNLRYGEHGIYHRLVNTGKGAIALFSVANIVKPGWFDPATMDDLSTPGIALFMQLPGPADGLVAFEEMHDAARRIAEQVGGRVLDGRRCALTGQALEAIREDLREYRRKQHLASRRQG